MKIIILRYQLQHGMKNSNYLMDHILYQMFKIIWKYIKSKMTKDENVPYLEINEVVLLIHCNVVNNSYQQNSRVSYTFVSNKSFSQLLDLLPKNFIFLKSFDSESSNPLEIEEKIDVTLVIN